MLSASAQNRQSSNELRSLQPHSSSLKPSQANASSALNGGLSVKPTLRQNYIKSSPPNALHGVGIAPDSRQGGGLAGMPPLIKGVEWLLSDTRASGIPDDLALLNAEWVEGEAAIEVLAGEAIAQLGGHASQYVTGSVKKILDRYEFARAGGWVAYGCTLDGKPGEVAHLKPIAPRPKLETLDLDYSGPRRTVGKGFQRVVKLDGSGQPKRVKYETPQGCPGTPLLSWVRWEDGLRAAERIGKGDAYRERMEQGQGEIDALFWRWWSEHSDEICIVEGFKKALSLLAAGYPAIALRGVSMWHKAGGRELHDVIAHFATPGRKVSIIFDQDTNLKTIADVRRQAIALGSELEKLGCHASFPLWMPSQGKGIDDLVVQSGVGALHEAIAQAVPFSEWKRGNFDAYLKGKHPELFGLTHTPAIELNQRYLPALELPQGGGLMAISSPIGTGKTEAMKSLIQRARAIDPGCHVELIGYRNSLGKQSAKRLSLDHIHDLQGSSYAQTFIDSASELAYCIDSLHRRIKAIRAAIARGQRVLILLDEFDAVLKHLLLGKTLEKRRGDIGQMFCELLKAVADGGGWVVAGEADLQSLPINFLEEMTGKPAQVIVNCWQGSPWQVEAVMPLNGELEVSPALMGKAAIARILSELQAGRRVAVPTDSRQWGEVLERVAAARGFSVLRLDGESSEELWAHELMKAPDEYLKTNPCKLFIYSPTAESGLSITGSHFDRMVVYGSHLEHRAIAQLMGRIRADIPRAVFCREFVLSDESGNQLDPDQLLKDWRTNARYSAMMAGLGHDAPSLELEGLAANLHRYAALYQARENISKANLRANLLETLQAQGHRIEETHQSPLGDELKAELKAVKETIESERAEALAIAEVLPLDQAQRIAQSSAAKRQERVQAEKTILLDRYPGLPVDDAGFNLRNLIQSRGRGLAEATNYFLVENPKVARAIDRVCFKSNAESRILWLPNISREGPKALLLEQSGILGLFKLSEYQESSPEIQAVRGFALKYQADIKRALGLWCSENHTGIQIAHKLARRLGMKAKIARHEGPRGDQIKIWEWQHDAEVESDRAAIFAALTRKWAELLEPLQAKDSSPVSSISDSRKPLTEIEDTAPRPPITPGGRALWRGQIWNVRAVQGAIATLTRVDDWAEVPESVPLTELEVA